MAPNLLRLPKDHERLVAGSESSGVDEFGLHSRVLEGIIQGVVIADADRRILAVNSRFERTSGYSAAELVGRNCRILQGAGTNPVTIQKIRDALNAGKPITTEILNYRKNGTPFWNEISISPVRDDWGRVVRFISIQRNVTAHRQELEKLRLDDLLIQVVAQSARIGGWKVELPSGLLTWTDGVYAIHEVEPGTPITVAEAIGFYTPERREQVQAAVEACGRDGTPIDLEVEIVTAKGQRLWVRAMGGADRDESGNVRQIWGSCQDITDRKREELERVTALAKKHAIVRVQQEIATLDLDLPAVMRLLAERAQMLMNADGAIVELLAGEEVFERATAGTIFDGTESSRSKKRLGALSERVVRGGALVICDDTEEDSGVNREVCQQLHIRSIIGVPLQVNREVVGLLKVVSRRAHAFRAEEGQSLQILVETLGVVLQRIRAADQLRKSEVNYRSIFEENVNAMWIFDLKSLRFLAVNQAAIAQYGYSEEEFLGMNLREIHSAGIIPDSEHALTVLREGDDASGLCRHYRKDGMRLHVEISVGRVEFAGRSAGLATIRDVTSRLANLRALTMLSACNEAMLRSDDEQELLAAVCRIAVEHGGYRMAWVGYARHDKARSIEPMAHFGADLSYIENIQATWREGDSRSQGPAGRCIRSGQVIAVEDLSQDSDFSPWREQAQVRGYRSLTGLPLRLGQETIGAVVLYAGECRVFSEEELSFLAELVEDLAFGIGAIRARQESARLQSALREKAALLDKASDAITVRDLDHHIRFWNKGAESLYGWVGEEVLGRSAGELLCTTASIFIEAAKKLRINGEWAGELPKVTRDGRRITVFTRWTLVKNEQGQPESILAVDADITEQKRAQEAQLVAAKRLELAARASKVGIWEWNVASEVFHWDAQMFALYGLSADIGGMTLAKWKCQVHPDDLDAAEQSLRDAIDNDGPAYEIGFRIVRPDGEVRNVRGQGVVLRDQTGRAERMIGSNWDVTAQVQREEELRENLEKEKCLRQQALAGEQAKGEFLAVMSHEIRTPMSGILGVAEILASSPSLSAEDRDSCDTILSSGEALLRILDDILDFSSIEAGQLSIEKRAFSLGKLIQSVQALFAWQIQRKGLRFLVSVDERVDDRIKGDVGRIRQVLLNLLGNALKFTESGEIELRATVAPTPDGDREVEFLVRDTGPGIPPDRTEAIFEPFLQLDSSISRRHGGTGLGLAISRRLAELMGGELALIPSPRPGTRFTLRVPYSPADPGDSLEPDARQPMSGADDTFSSRHPLRILIAEDDRLNRRLVVSVLRKLGYEPFEAGNGREAVEVYERERPDCVLMDMQMPEMDGIEATEVIRSTERQRDLPAAYVSALTANVLPVDRNRCFSAGMNHYLNKPIRREAIAEVLVEAWRFRRRVAGNAAISPARSSTISPDS